MMAWPTHIVAAAGYVEDGRGTLLLVKVNDRGWDAPGGQVEAGENLEEGVLREILEESGIVATVRCLAGVYSNVGQHLYYDNATRVPTKVMFDFLCDYVSGEPTPSAETGEVIWAPKDKVLEYVTSPAQRFRFQRALAFDGRICYGAYVSKPEFRLLTDRYI